MPVALTDETLHCEPIHAPVKRWSRAEYLALTDSVLPNQHLELVEGELIDKMGKKRPHVNTLTSVMVWLVRVFGEQFVNPEAPIDVSPEDNLRNEPEPDLIVLVRPMWDIQGNPQPHDLRVVVEISDTTLGFDLTTKAALYARAAVIEYWVVDVTGRRLIVHRQPEAGRYSSVIAYGADERVSPLSAPDARFCLGECLSPAAAP